MFLGTHLLTCSDMYHAGLMQLTRPAHKWAEVGSASECCSSMSSADPGSRQARGRAVHRTKGSAAQDPGQGTQIKYPFPMIGIMFGMMIVTVINILTIILIIILNIILIH